MATFTDTLFPTEVSAWAVGGRGFKTTVVTTYGGEEYRNAAWAQALGEWDIADAFRSTNPNSAYNVKALRNFIMAGMGQLYGFRFRDPQDNKDEGAGVIKATTGGNGQLYKRYTIGSLTFDQIIQKPTADVVVSAGVLNVNTGAITGASTGTWTGTFDIPCRFADDFPHIGLDSSGALWDWQQVKIIEWKNWA